ncbi:hypothetical protein QUB28_11480 [Microcoleus sp. B4-C3]|uniref:hypothetical protein n=1 Tax=Microcoleus sp. B4-C2 TaxID=2818661 RepID=UPI002FD27E84
MDASTRFFYEHTKTEGEGDRFKNRLYPLIRGSTTMIRAIAPPQVSEKTTIYES